MRVRVHDSGPDGPRTDAGKKRRREVRGFAKILQKFLASRATTSSRPLTLATVDALRVCLGPKQTDLYSCGVYTCWAVLCEAVALELGAQWCPEFECVSQDVPVSDLLLLRHFIAQMLMDPVKIRTLARLAQVTAVQPAQPTQPTA